jgi:site-specific DNA recombinase
MNTMKQSKKVRVAAYIRVSTDEQAKEGYGLDTQLRHIKNEIEKFKDKGWTFDEKLLYKDDGYSGSLSTRPALDRMLKDAKAKKFDIMLVWKIDRLYRHMRYLLETIDKLGEYEIDFKSVTEPFDTTAVGKFIFQMFGALAEFERNLIITRTSEGKISSAKDGNYVGGNVPYGYMVKNRRLTIYELEAKWVRKIFTWFVDFEYPIDEIAKRLEKLGVPSQGAHGKNKKSRKRGRSACFWHRSTVSNLLKRTNYIGTYYYNKKGKDKHGKEIFKPKNEWIEFSCPSIIDKETFNKAQKRLEEIKKRSNNAKTIYLLSGKIHCGNCGSIFTGYTSTKKTKNYRCGKNNKAKTRIKCKAKHISENIIGNAIWDRIQVFLENPEAILKEIEEELKKDSYHQSLVEEREVLLKKVNKAKDTRKRIKEAFRRGTFTQDELEEELGLVDREYQTYKEELEAINAQLQVEDSKTEKLLSIKEIAKKHKKGLKRLLYEDKYDIIQAVVKKVTVKGEEIQMELRVPKVLKAKNKIKLNNVYGGRE